MAALSGINSVVLFGGYIFTCPYFVILNPVASFLIGVVLTIGSFVVLCVALIRSWRIGGRYRRVYVGAIVSLAAFVPVVVYNVILWHSIVTGGF